MKLLTLLLAASLSLARAADPAGDAAFQSVVVKPGDTLWAIANTYLKDPTKWDAILKYNRQLTNDPTVALPGMTLRVPIALIKEELRAARLVHRLNEVLYRRRQTAAWNQTQDKMELYPNDGLRTMTQGQARVQFVSGATLSLEQNSMAIIKPENKDIEVELKKGGTYVGRAKIITAAAVVQPKTTGTRYSARVLNDLTTRVEVYEGKAGVTAGGKTVDVDAGLATQVKMGAAPMAPVGIADLPDFQAPGENLDESIRNARLTVKISASSQAPDLTKLDAPANLGNDLKQLGLGKPISGWHIKLSKTKDFKEVLLDKTFYVEERMSFTANGIKPGKYWMKIAVIDLLGMKGKFGEPKLYAVTD